MEMGSMLVKGGAQGSWVGRSAGDREPAVSARRRHRKYAARRRLPVCTAVSGVPDPA